MRESLALVAREWRLVRRSAQMVVMLLGLCFATILVNRSAVLRHELLDPAVEPRFISTMGAVLMGILLADLSFGTEMRQGTWDGLLLLPCPRGLWLSVKLGMGALLIAASVVIPILVLWTGLAMCQAIGGPLPGAGELLAQRWVSGAVLVGACTYLVTASVSLLNRERLIASLLRLVIPVFGCGVAIDRFEDASSVAVLVALTAVLLAVVVETVRGSGRPPSGALFALRAISLVPATLVMLGVVEGLVEREMREAARTLPAKEAASQEAQPRPHLTDDPDGHMVALQSSVPGVKLDRIHPRSAIGRTARKGSHFSWYPVRHSEYGGLSLFWTPERGALLGFGGSSGAPLGCVSRGGWGVEPCLSWTAPPLVVMERFQLVTLASTQGLLDVDPETGEALEVYPGEVTSVGDASRSSGDARLALQSGADLRIASRSADDGYVHGSQPRIVPPWVWQRCAGVASDGRIGRVTGDLFFLRVRIVHTDGRPDTLAVCRDGVVVERQSDPQVVREESTSLPVADARLLVMAGPLPGELLPHRPGPLQRQAPVGWQRVWGLVGATGSAFVVGAALWRRRRELPRSALAAGVLGSLLLGPSYALACLLLLVRRRLTSGAIVT